MEYENSLSSSHERPAAASSAVVVVESSELLQEHKCEDSVGSETSVVGSEAFPETEEPFALYQPTQYLLLLYIEQ